MNLEQRLRWKYKRYQFDEEQEVILKMKKCQRNWDYSKTIPEDIVNQLLWIATNAPSKQFEAFYDVYYTTDRNVIEDLYRYAWGNTQARTPTSCIRNSAMNANMYMLFVCKQPPTMVCTDNNGSPSKKDSRGRWENGLVHVGIAMGLVMQAATRHGLSTGCNKSNSTGPDCNYYWEKKLGIYEDVVIKKTKKMLYGIGIGYPNEGRPRWESDDNEICIGAGNGHNLTALEETDPNFLEKNPITGETYRKTKIVNIKEHRTAVDPYGDIHEIPEKIEYTVHSTDFRDIKCIKIL